MHTGAGDRASDGRHAGSRLAEGVGGPHRNLRRSVEVPEPTPRAPPFQQLRRAGLPRHDQIRQLGERRLRQRRQHGGHEQQVGEGFAVRHGHEARSEEVALPWHQHRGRPRGQCGEEVEQAAIKVEGERIGKARTRTQAQERGGRGHHVGNPPMLHQHPIRQAGGARGEEHIGQGVIRQRQVGPLVGSGGQSFLQRDPRDFGSHLPVVGGGVDDQAGRHRISHHGPQPLPRQFRIQDDERRTGLQHPEQGDDHLQAAGKLQGHPVAPGHAAVDQGVGQTVRTLFKLAVAQH